MIRHQTPAGNGLAFGCFLTAAGVLSVLAGCDGPAIGRAVDAARTMIDGSHDEAVLRIATSWPKATRDQIEKEFLEWLSREPAGPEPVSTRGRLAWIVTDRRDSLDQPASRLLPADVLLGGPVWQYTRLE